MFRRVTLKEQIRRERQKLLAEKNERNEAEKVMLEQLVDMDFRQSMTEMGVR